MTRHLVFRLLAPRVCLPLGVLVLQFTGAALSQIPTSAAMDPTSAVCIRHPTRACVLEQALASALTIETALERYLSLHAVAKAQEKENLTASSHSRVAAAAALNEAHHIARTQSLSDAHRGSLVLRSIALGQLELGLTTEAGATLREALHVVRQATGYPGGVARQAIAEAQVMAGLRAEAAATFDQALEVMRTYDDSWLRANEPRRVAESQLKASMPDAAVVALSQALDAAHAIQDERIRVQALAFIAATQLQAGLPDEATRTFARALQFAAAIRHQSTSNAALRVIAAKQAESGMDTSAATTLDQTLQSALAATSHEQRFSELFGTSRALVELRMTAKVSAILQQALEAAKGTNRAATILAVADIQVKAGLLSDAVATLQQAPTSPTKAEGPFHASSPENAQAAAVQNQDGYDRQRVGIFSSLAEAQAARGLRGDAESSLGEGLRIARSIRSAVIRAHALSAIVRTRMASGLIEKADLMSEAAGAFIEAAEQAQAMSSDFPRHYTLDSVARSLVAVAQAMAKAGSMSEALNVFDHALRVAREMMDPTSRSKAIRALAEAYAKAGRIGDALEVAQSIELSAERTTALISIAEAVPN